METEAQELTSHHRLAPSTPPRLAYRALDILRDMQRLKELHDLCFPIQYDNVFYEWMKSAHCVALVAVTVCDALTTVAPMGSVHQDEAAAAASEEEYVVGFIVGKLKYIEGPVFTQPVMYISTFGVDPEYRSKGVGHELLERFVSLVRSPTFVAENPACDAVRRSNASGLLCLLSRLGLPKPNRIEQVWLHCLATDDLVVRFYTKRRFVMVDHVYRYYDFGGAEHDGLLMCREEHTESWSDAGNRKRDGGHRRAGRAQTLWERLAGTTTHEALQSQDDLDTRRWLEPKVSGAAWCMLGCVIVAIVVVVTLWKTVTSQGREGGARY